MRTILVEPVSLIAKMHYSVFLIPVRVAPSSDRLKLLKNTIHQSADNDKVVFVQRANLGSGLNDHETLRTDLR